MPPTEDLAVSEQREGFPTSSQTSTTPVLTRSWVNVAQEQRSLKKYEVEITKTDGVDSVLVPDEVFHDPSPLWEDFLIGKFLEKAPHVGKVHAIVNKIWVTDKSKMVEVYVLNATTMKFRIINPEMRKRILKRGMWNLAGVPAVMSKWVPFAEEVQPEQTSVPLWVHMRKVPMNMFSWKGLSFLSSPVGIPDRLHPETAQCVDFKVAKIFVKADLTKELPRVVTFKVQGKEARVEYSYPWLPTKCTRCGKWGHSVQTCAVKENSRDENMSQNAVEEAVIQEKGVEVGEDHDVQAVDETCADQTENMEKENEVKKVLENEWKTVSPGKVGRSAEKRGKYIEQEHDSILSNSRFSVLSLDEEDGEIVERMEEAEKGDLEEVEKSVEETTETQTSLREELKNLGVEEIQEKETQLTIPPEGTEKVGLVKNTEDIEKLLETPKEGTSQKVVATVTKGRDTAPLRPSLSRSSKDNHSILSNSAVQKATDASSFLNKKSLKKNH